RHLPCPTAHPLHARAAPLLHRPAATGTSLPFFSWGHLAARGRQDRGAAARRANALRPIGAADPAGVMEIREPAPYIGAAPGTHPSKALCDDENRPAGAGDRAYE